MHPNCLRKLMHFYPYLLIRKFHFPLNQYISEILTLGYFPSNIVAKKKKITGKLDIIIQTRH